MTGILTAQGIEPGIRPRFSACHWVRIVLHCVTEKMPVDLHIPWAINKVCLVVAFVLMVGGGGCDLDFVLSDITNLANRLNNVLHRYD